MTTKAENKDETRVSSEVQGAPVTVPAALRWQYVVARPWTVDTLELLLNELGAEGWELVTMAGNYPVLKRQVSD